MIARNPTAERPTAPGAEESEARWPRPRLLLTACVDLQAPPLDGWRERLLPSLAQWTDVLPLCPPLEAGIRGLRFVGGLVDRDGSVRRFPAAAPRERGSPAAAAADRLLAGLDEVDGVLVRGPCPCRAGEGGALPDAAAAWHPFAVLEDEASLASASLRHHFLTRLFQSARLRRLPETHAALQRFHAGSKLLLLACDEPGSRRLGRLLANADGLPAAELKRRYREGFARALARPPAPGPLANALQHAFGHFSEVLEPAEKRVFMDLLHGFGQRRASLEALVGLIRVWTARHGRDWLEEQSLLLPYPDALHAVAEPAGGAART